MCFKLHPSVISDLDAFSRLDNMWLRSDVPLYYDATLTQVLDNPVSLELVTIGDIRCLARPTLTVLDGDGNEVYTGFPLLLDAEDLASASEPSISWQSIVGKPTTLSGFNIVVGDTLFDTKYAASSHTHTFASLTSKPTTLSGYGVLSSDTLFDAKYVNQSVQYTNPTWLAGIDASTIKTGTIDPARIPVMPSQTPVVSSGLLANLTTQQQSTIGAGTVVTTTDGNRYVYTGTGDKTLAASYIQLADITPEWTAISNRPTAVSYWSNDAGYLTAVTAGSLYQPLDADLTAIAALTTQTFGRSLLTAADAAAGRSLLGAGTVTSVGLTAPALMTAGAAVTGSGNLSLTWNGSSANLVRADGSTVASSAFQPAGSYQPLDADLTAIAALATTGFVRRTAADTWAASAISWADISGVISYGTSAGTVCQGNDSRLSDARTPTSHTHSSLVQTGTAPSSTAAPSTWATPGLDVRRSTNTGAYPSAYGNILTLSGDGYGQIQIGMNMGASPVNSGMWFRNSRDVVDSFSSWARVLDTATDATSISQWNAAFTNSHTHSNKYYLDTINQALSTFSVVSFQQMTANRVYVTSLSSPGNLVCLSTDGTKELSLGPGYIDASNYFHVTYATDFTKYVTMSEGLLVTGNISASTSFTEAGVLLSDKYQAKGSYAASSHTHPWDQIGSRTVSVASVKDRIDSGWYQYAQPRVANGWPVDADAWWHLFSSTHSNGASYYALQLAAHFNSQDFRIRSTNGSGTTSWSTIWTTTNLVGDQSSHYHSADRAWGNITGKPTTISNFADGVWAGPSTAYGWVASSTTRFGFSASGTAFVDVYADGNFFATDSMYRCWHAGDFSATTISSWNNAASLSQHSNRSYLDVINQNLSSTSLVSFSGVAVYQSVGGTEVWHSGPHLELSNWNGTSISQGWRFQVNSTTSGTSSNVLNLYNYSNSGGTSAWYNVGEVYRINAGGVNLGTQIRIGDAAMGDWGGDPTYAWFGFYGHGVSSSPWAGLISRADGTVSLNALTGANVYLSYGGNERLRAHSSGVTIWNDLTVGSCAYVSFLRVNKAWTDSTAARIGGDLAADGTIWAPQLKVNGADVTSTTIANWNQAYSWASAARINQQAYTGEDSLTWASRNERGNHFGRMHGVSSSPSYFNFLHILETTGTVWGAIGHSADGNWYVCRGTSGSEPSNYFRVWTTMSFGDSDISKWNTAGNRCATSSNPYGISRLYRNDVSSFPEYYVYTQWDSRNSGIQGASAWRLLAANDRGDGQAGIYTTACDFADYLSTPWGINPTYVFFGRKAGNTSSWSTTVGFAANTNDCWVSAIGSLAVCAGNNTSALYVSSTTVQTNNELYSTASWVGSAIGCNDSLGSASRIGVVNSAKNLGWLLSLGSSSDLQFWCSPTTSGAWTKLGSISSTGMATFKKIGGHASQYQSVASGTAATISSTAGTFVEVSVAATLTLAAGGANDADWFKFIMNVYSGPLTINAAGGAGIRNVATGGSATTVSLGTGKACLVGYCGAYGYFVSWLA